MGRACYAHTVPGRPVSEWQVLEEHLLGTANMAAAMAEAFGAGEWARLAGLWHDLGKYSDAFQRYLGSSSTSASDPHPAELCGQVDHSTAGAQHAACRGPTGRLLAYCIAGHHAGLPDHAGEESCLRARLTRSVEPIPAAPPGLLDVPLPPPPRLRPADPRHAGFTLAFYTRMLFSCLVDADFLDTEAFLNPGRARIREFERASCDRLLARLDAYLAEKQARADDTPLNRRRGEILAACREKAQLAPGFFSLHVPTGGGKTLSSLAFALRHAVAHGLVRVVYAIPFTSIIEQTADVFREALGGLSGEVLEHHSSLEPDDPVRQSTRSRLAAENFDATLVVTTNVQLFESLFSSRSSRCRKLHRLARSVIILDEAQTLPVALLAPTLAALRELVANYGATVVLCSATQPAIEARPGFRIGLDGVRPLVDDPARLHEEFRRTAVERLGPIAVGELAARLRAEPQVLCIVNSRRHAAELFRTLGDPDAFHLSASMCAAHRSDALDQIRSGLQSGRAVPCRVVSTQVIEAGVDVDFPAVYRAAAGLDAIAQAAGRCNREGRLADEQGRPRPGRVAVFEYDAKAYPTTPLIARAAAHFREVAPDHQADLLAPAAVGAYFRLHYWQQGGDDGRGWDRGVDGQSVMECFELDPKDLLHAQFRTAAGAYRLIEDTQTPVLVSYGDRGRRLIDELASMPPDPDPTWLRAFDRAAQRYVVGVYDRGLRTLLENGVLLELHGRYYLGNPQAYDGKLGLSFEAIGLDPELLTF